MMWTPTIPYHLLNTLFYIMSTEVIVPFHRERDVIIGWPIYNFFDESCPHVSCNVLITIEWQIVFEVSHRAHCVGIIPTSFTSTIFWQINIYRTSWSLNYRNRFFALAVVVVENYWLKTSTQFLQKKFFTKKEINL